MTAPRERHLDLSWGKVALLESGHQDGPPLLCLHGWMDNAASFLPLMEQLPEAHWVAVDFAGHGQSDHRPEHTRYHFAEYLYDLDETLDLLGWDRCTLVGHSLGSAVAACYACADPQRVERMIWLDGMGVVIEDPAEAGHRLAKSLRSVRNPRDHRRKFPSPELAARARQMKNPMSDSSAMLLATRALNQVEDGWRWRTDPRAMWDSPVRMTEPQSNHILELIACPVLAMVTPILENYLGEGLLSRRKALRQGAVMEIPGGHHVHMDEPQRLVSPIREFLNLQGVSHD